MDTRGGQSTVMSAVPGGCSRPVTVSGGTTYAVAGAAGAGGDMNPRRPVTADSCGSRVDGHRGRSETDRWNPRASMAFDSAKGLLNPAGENNCFLNSAVQVYNVS